MRPPRWAWWTLATTVGYAVGMAVSVALVGATARPLGAVLGGLVFIALFGAVIGIGIGIAQLPAFPRGAVRPHLWLAGMAIGGAIGLVLASVVGEQLGNLV